MRTAVGIILSSRYGMFVWWGRQLINLYNDAYRPFLGKKHPDALGQSAREMQERQAIHDALRTLGFLRKELQVTSDERNPASQQRRAG